jgi:tRNA pseudouridine65 synthase
MAGLLSSCLASAEAAKEYVAVVRGTMAERVIEVDHALTRKSGPSLPAITRVEPRAIARDRYTLVAAWPYTGRTHQIRRHLKHLSRPVLGDVRYGDGRENRKMREEVGLHRLALHARRIRLPHPDVSRGIIEVEAPLPPDLREPLARLGFDDDALDR